MPNVRTQQLVAEVSSPTYASKQDIVAAVEAILPVLAKAAQQAMEISNAAQLARISENNADIRGRLEPYWQTAGAIQREAANAEKAICRIVDLFDQLNDCNAHCISAIDEPEKTRELNT